MNRAVAGVLSGLAATYPMTLVMRGLHQQLPARDQHTLPPRKLTMDAAELTGADEQLDDEIERREATLATHFGIGATMGLVYGLIAPRHPRSAAARGLLYGFAVWLVNYGGVLPAVGHRSGATRESGPRNALMIIAHLVFGLFLAAAFEPLRPRRTRRALNSEAWSATKREEDLFP